MANPWFRLWNDMVNDPKFRTIARVSKQEVSRVLSVYLYMMTCASNATERGRTEGWCDEDVATALSIETSDVESIREAMQGRVLEGDYLSGWEKRQPLKEDGSAERAKAWREAKKTAKEHEQTTPNESERQGTQEEIRGDKNLKALSGKPDAVEVLTHLNAKTSRAYEPVESNLKLIVARLNEGATVEQCKAVIDSKVLEWLNDAKMSEFLRPKTLFNATNYAQYVGALGASTPAEKAVKKVGGVAYK